MHESAPQPPRIQQEPGMPPVFRSEYLDNPDLVATLRTSMDKVETKKRPPLEELTSSFYDKLEDAQGEQDDVFEPIEKALDTGYATHGDIAAKLIDKGVTLDEIDGARVSKNIEANSHLSGNGGDGDKAATDKALKERTLLGGIMEEMVAARVEGWDETPERMMMANRMAEQQVKPLPFPELYEQSRKKDEEMLALLKVREVGETAVGHEVEASDSVAQETQPKRLHSQETAREDNSEQDERNSEILRQAEFGVVLERAYIEAVNLDPRLEAVEIVPIDSEVSSIARARPAWRSETGKHQVEVPLDNLDEHLKKIDETFSAIPGAKKMIAEKMGIEEDDITPEALLVFGFLHELGHITEYMDNEDNPQELAKRIKEEKMALPIAGVSVSAMMQEGSRINEAIKKNWGAIQSRYDEVKSIEDLFEKQHVAYRSMTSEKHADDFAESLLGINPIIVEQMIHPDREVYRHWDAVTGTAK